MGGAASVGGVRTPADAPQAPAVPPRARTVGLLRKTVMLSGFNLSRCLTVRNPKSIAFLQEIVPGSHRRPLTADERAVLPPPWGAGSYPNRMGRRSEPSGDPCAMPGGVPASLRPGECLFFDSGLLHNGLMLFDKERLELHCHTSAIVPGQEPAPKDCGPKHYWMTHPAVRDGLPARIQPAWDRFVAFEANSLPDEVHALNARPFAPGGPQTDLARAHVMGGREGPSHHSNYPSLAERLQYGLRAAPGTAAAVGQGEAALVPVASKL